MRPLEDRNGRALDDHHRPSQTHVRPYIVPGLPLWVLDVLMACVKNHCCSPREPHLLPPEPADRSYCCSVSLTRPADFRFQYTRELEDGRGVR
jgi:hypothetical protein